MMDNAEQTEIKKPIEKHGPFRWSTPTRIPLSSLKVYDTDRALKIELFTPSSMSEKPFQMIEVPFLPRAMHADCIEVTEHERRMADRVAAADAKVTEQSEKIKDLEEETERLKRQVAAANAIILAIRPLQAQLIVRGRMSQGHDLRASLAAYDAEEFPEYVTQGDADRETAIAVRKATTDSALAIQQLIETIEMLGQRLSDVAAQHSVDISSTLALADNATAKWRAP